MSSSSRTSPPFVREALLLFFRDWRPPDTAPNGHSPPPETSARPTDASGFSSSLWPTPRSSPNENRQTKPTPSQLAGEHGWPLGVTVNLWPTPVAHDDGKSPEAHLAMKARMKGGPRHTITSLTVMVKAGDQGLWPTPRNAGFDAGGHRGRADSTHAAVKMWPTASATDGEGSRTVPEGTTFTGRRPDGKKAQIGLQTATRFWPTATATDARGSRNVTSGRTDPDSKHHSGTTLTDATRVWPTPTTRDFKGTGDLSRVNARPGRPPDLVPRVVQALDPGNTAPLNPAWVEALMGFPAGWTELPPEVIAGLSPPARRKPTGSRRARRSASTSGPTD